MKYENVVAMEGERTLRIGASVQQLKAAFDALDGASYMRATEVASELRKFGEAANKRHIVQMADPVSLRLEHLGLETVDDLRGVTVGMLTEECSMRRMDAERVVAHFAPVQVAVAHATAVEASADAAKLASQQTSQGAKQGAEADSVPGRCLGRRVRRCPVRTARRRPWTGLTPRCRCLSLRCKP